MGNCTSSNSGAVSSAAGPADLRNTAAIHVIDDNDAMAKAAAEHIVALALEKAKGAGGGSATDSQRLTVALAGGSTPKAVYQYLARHHPNIVSDHLEVFFGDVRMVHDEHDDSNYAMARDSLFFAPVGDDNGAKKRLVSDEHVHTVDTAKDPVTAAKLYEEEIRKYFNCLDSKDTPKFDLIMLGFGPDGHTASLFPHTKASEEKDLLVTDCMPTPNVKPLVHRVTITKRLINHADNIMVLARGEEKRWVLEGVLNNKASPLGVANKPEGGTSGDEKSNALPVAAFLRESKSRMHFYLDGAAAPPQVANRKK